VLVLGGPEEARETKGRREEERGEESTFKPLI
jgi:hypothetical protein